MTTCPADTPPQATATRYRTLDAWRGVAALAVLLFHAVSPVVPEGGGPLAAVCRQGLFGVFIFFPLSGYCILAAVEADPQRRVGRYLWRRAWRILPPYWASIVWSILLVGATSLINHGNFHELDWPWRVWLSIVTLTQGWIGFQHVLNFVYWTLGYEAQFYLFMALVVLCPPRGRPWLLLAFALVGAVWAGLPWREVYPAALPRYAPAFAAGMAVFGWNHPGYGRAWAAVMLGLAAIGAWPGLVAVVLGVAGPEALGVWDMQLAVSAGVSAMLIALRPWDTVLARQALVRPLMAVGRFSYSLYLVHAPVMLLGYSVVYRLAPEGVPEWAAVACMAAAVGLGLLGGWVFFHAVERHFLPRSESRG